MGITKNIIGFCFTILKINSNFLFQLIHSLKMNETFGIDFIVN